MPLPAAVLPIAGAVLGAIGGGQGQQSSSSTQSQSGINLVAQTEAGAAADKNIFTDYEALGGLVNAGAGQADVSAGAQSQRDLASLLAEYSRTGAIPTAADISGANRFTNDIYAAQQVSLNQGFEDQNVQAQRLAAQLGRPVNDPIIQNKLMQERMRQQASLDAQKTGFQANFAQQQPLQRLGFSQQLADVRGNLATQAMANRQALLSVGQSIQGNERNWRQAISTKWNNSTTTGSQGGGVGGAIGGALAGLGGGLSAQNSFFGGFDSSKIVGGNEALTLGAGESYAPVSGAVNGPSYAPVSSFLSGGTNSRQAIGPQAPASPFLSHAQMNRPNRGMP